MATARFEAFVNGIAGITPPSIVFDFGMEPPGSMTTAHLPAKFLKLPREERSRFAFCIDGADAQGSGMMTIEVVIVLNPTIQGTPEDNFTQTVGLIDEVVQTLVQIDDDAICISVPTVSVRVTRYIVAGIEYWVVIAEVTARG